MYVVAYDITENKERDKVAKVLNEFGERVQKSVWSCDIDSTTCARLRFRLAELEIKTGIIHIWLTQAEPWMIGDAENVPKQNYAHFL